MMDQGETTYDKPKESVIRVKRIMNAVTSLLPGDHSTHDSVADSGSGEGTPETRNSTYSRKQHRPPDKHRLPPTPPTNVHNKKPRKNAAVAPSPAPPTLRTLRNLPKVAIIGSKCAGTDILTQLLGLHPQIHISNNTYQQLLDNSLRKRHLPIARHGQIIVDWSSGLFSMKLAPQYISKWSPGLKLILMLRDPIDHTLACYRRVTQHIEGSGLRSFEDYVVNSKGKLNVKSDFIVDSTYDVHLSNWLTYFNTSRWFFLDFYQLTTQPFVTLNKLEKFLQIQQFFKRDHFLYNKQQSLCINNKLISQYKLPAPLCLQNNSTINEISLGVDLEDQLKEYFVPKMEHTLSLVSSRISLGDLVSLMN